MATSNPRLPDFPDLGQDHPDRFKLADEWREIHAKPRRRKLLPDRPDGKKPPEGGGGDAQSSAPNNPPRPQVHNPPEDNLSDAQLDDERARITGNFEDWALETAEKAAIMAAHKHRVAMLSGDAIKIANATTTLNETLRRVREQRVEWMDLRERSRRTISIDRAQQLLSPVLNALERRLKGMGARVGPDANPGEPARAARAIDSEIDLLFEQIAAALQTIEEAKLEDPNSEGETPATTPAAAA